MNGTSWLRTSRTARLPDPPAGMIKVSVSPSGRLLPGGDGGIVEWVKAEDLQRMEEESLVEPEIEAQPAEESFDIF